MIFFLCPMSLSSLAPTSLKLHQVDSKAGRLMGGKRGKMEDMNAILSRFHFKKCMGFAETVILGRCVLSICSAYIYILSSLLMSFAACQMILCERSKFIQLERSTSCQIKSPPWSVNKTISKRTKPSTVGRGWKSTFQQSLPGPNKVESSIFAMPLEQKAAKSLNLAGAGNCC